MGNLKKNLNVMATNKAMFSSRFEGKTQAEMLAIGKIILGNVLLGFAYAQWMRPNGIINGGVTSLAMIFERLTPISVIILANGITIFLLVLCLIYLGRERFLKSIFSGICYNIFFALFTILPLGLNVHLAVDLMLACLMISWGYYLCLSAKSTAVSMDVIALIIHKKMPDQPVAKILRFINLMVLTAGLFVYGVLSVALGALFSVITTYLLQYYTKKSTME